VDVAAVLAEAAAMRGVGALEDLAEEAPAAGGRISEKIGKQGSGSREQEGK
jgi:hypothetical protein